MKIDPCLVICVLALAVIMPIGFTIDHKPFVCKCAESPHLYLGHEANLAKIINAINSSNYSVKIISSSRRGPNSILQDSADLSKCLNNKAQQGVKIDIVDSNAINPKSLDNKTNYVHFNIINQTLLITLIIIDNSRVVFASQMFTYNSKSQETDFVVDYTNCDSIAAESIEIFNFIKQVAIDSTINLFPHYYSPGYSYPADHISTDGKTNSTFSIAHSRYVCRNRTYTVDLIHDFFTNSTANISLFSGDLFPSPEQGQNDDLTFLISNLIESAVTRYNADVKIITKRQTLPTISDAISSLSKVKGINLRVTPNSYAAYFVRNDTAVFMPIPFNVAYANNVIYMALRIKDVDIANEVQAHFDESWEKSNSTITNI